MSIWIVGIRDAKYSFGSIYNLCSNPWSLILINRNYCLIFNLKFRSASLFPVWGLLNIHGPSWICIKWEGFFLLQGGWPYSREGSQACKHPLFSSFSSPRPPRPTSWTPLHRISALGGKQIVTICNGRWRKEAGRVSIVTSLSSEAVDGNEIPDAESSHHLYSYVCVWAASGLGLQSDRDPLVVLCLLRLEKVPVRQETLCRMIFRHSGNACEHLDGGGMWEALRHPHIPLLYGVRGVWVVRAWEELWQAGMSAQSRKDFRKGNHVGTLLTESTRPDHSRTLPSLASGPDRA